MSTGLAVKEIPLPEPVARRGINEAQWRTLCTSLYPGADPKSVLLVLDYCAARRLDPMKRPCHIVPLRVKVGATWEWRDTVMPGIYELRTTAQRTGQYLGHARPEYGPLVDYLGVKAPEWCDFTAYRWNAVALRMAEFPVRTFFREVVGTKADGKVNDRWSKAPTQMLVKCAEAAALREAFPDELGGEQTAEEMEGRTIGDLPPLPISNKPELVKPDAYDSWLLDMQAVADEGSAMLSEAWKNTPQLTREYLTSVDASGWEQLKARAVQADAEKNKPEPAA